MAGQRDPLRPGQPTRWRIGLLTDQDEFVGVVQQQDDVDDLLTQYVDENPSQGEDAAPANGLGATVGRPGRTRAATTRSRPS